MRYTERPKPPIGTKDMLYSLLQVRPAMEKLYGQKKEYAPLIAALMDLPPDAKLPTAKSLQQQLGISAAVFRRWAENWHDDFLGLIQEDADVLQFRQVEYLFCVPGPRDYITFLCRLAVPPQVGEGVELGFISGVTGSAIYHVDNVAHEYLHDKIQVVVRLREGYYDPYVHHLCHRARFEKTLTWEEESQLSGYAAEKRLYEIYGRPAQATPVYQPPVAVGRRRRFGD
ncbi:hypothetical protein [Hymenobacter latericus]|uniref:hypothetical protein n=1 Tax=Hymenobacter sp. YIM 151858-1 TaxID=2987688 RepID=UPI002227CE86|nr:hypothetical protein [Hymenobacter sp. YIM 151858-1]UYZ58072.1 hypothetical protein OIS50_13505 [Hymenobacter sp. YIM 151858-1]